MEVAAADMAVDSEAAVEAEVILKKCQQSLIFHSQAMEVVDMVAAVTVATEVDAEEAEEATAADVVEEEEDTEMAGK